MKQTLYFYSRFIHKQLEGQPPSPELRPKSSLRNFLFRNLKSSEKEEFDLTDSINTLGASTNLHVRNIALTLVLAGIQKKAMLPSEFLAPFEKPYLTPDEIEHNEMLPPLIRDLDEDAAKIPISPRTAIRRLIDGFLGPLKKRYEQWKEDRKFVGFSPGLQLSDELFASLKITRDDVEGLYTEEDFQEARGDLYDFLNNYPSLDFETLATHLQNISAEFSDRINIYKLFDAEMIELFEKKLQESVKTITLETYRQFFQRNEKEFAFYFLFSRIISIDQQGAPSIDEKSLKELLVFLSDQQKLSENDLYLLIYDTLRTWFCILRENSRFRTRMRIAIPGLLADDSDESSVFHYQFDFDTFFHRHFSPVIRQIRDKQMPNHHHHVEIVDILSLDPQHMSRTLYPKRALEPISRLAELSEEEFTSFLRSFLNYESVPVTSNGNHSDTSDEAPAMNYLQLSDEQVKELVSLQLDRVEAQIRYTTELAFTLRDEDDPVRRRCQFLQEIIQCRDFRKLVSWLSNPVKFREEFPQHNAVSLRKIQHESRKMLEMFLFYRKNRFRHAFKQRMHWQNLIEQHFMGRLKIEFSLPVQIPVRIKIELDPEMDEPKLYPQPDGSQAPRYEFVNLFDQISNPKLSQYVGKMDETIILEEDGKKFRVFPVEMRRFIAATAYVPLPDHEEPHRMQIWIYNPDGRFMHAKGEESFISSWLRGKVPSDILRNTIVTNNPEDADILRRFHYSSYSSGAGSDTKISDRTAGREKGRRPKKGRGSKQFVEKRDFSFAAYATLLDAFQDEVDSAFSETNPVLRQQKLEALLNKHTHIEYETQIMNFGTIFLALSDYTTVSHNRAYKPKLEWEILFQHYFPPTVYGQEFADDYLAGFQGNGLGE